MDTRTGDIFASRLKLESTIGPVAAKQFAKEMQIKPTVKQLKRKPIDMRAIGRVGRNEKCPCGSGKKFKFCCLNV